MREIHGEKFSKLHFPEVELGGLGFPQREGERGWYDFPEETGYGLLSEKKYRHAMEISAPKPDYPEWAMDVRPETADEMEKWRIDPAGARPGIPSVRGFLAVAPGTLDIAEEADAPPPILAMNDLSVPPAQPP